MQPQAAAPRVLSAAPLAAAALSLCCSPASQPTPSPVHIPAASAAPTPARPPPRDPRIRQLSAGVYEVEASLFDLLIEQPSRVAPRTWAEPVEEDGKLVGYRLRGVTPGILGRLGLVEDDIVRVINGQSSTSPSNIEAARDTARRTGQVAVVLLRNGFDKLLVYQLVYY